MCSPSATALFVGSASLLHLPPKFSVTFTFTITGTEFGNSAYIMQHLTILISKLHTIPPLEIKYTKFINLIPPEALHAIPQKNSCKLIHHLLKQWICTIK